MRKTKRARTNKKAEADAQFRLAAERYIRANWKKLKNPLLPRRPAAYPARVTCLMPVTIGGKTALFRICVQESGVEAPKLSRLEVCSLEDFRGSRKP